MISSLTNKKVKELTKLNQAKYRKDRYILRDRDMIDIAISRGLCELLVTLEDIEAKVPVMAVTKEVMAKISQDSSELLAICKKEERSVISKKVILLDDLADPQNIGTIIASAYSFGFGGVYLSANCADIYHPKCLKAAGPAFYDMPCIYTNLDELILNLQAKGIKVLATGLHDETVDLYDCPIFEEVAIIMGSEARGIKDKYYTMTDGVIKIPMANIDSLNVAIATGIILEHFANRGL